MKNFILVVLAIGTLFLGGSLRSVRGAKAEKKPVVVEPHLLKFGASWCPPCVRMEPLIEKLEKEEKVRVERYDVSTSTGDAKFSEWNERLGNPCGGIPFFVNTKTLKFICGATDYEVLKSWALEKPKK